MKTLTPAFLLALLMLIAFSASESRAETYRWCAIYGASMGYEATNCGFVTYQQCLDTISGIGGSCQENPRYTGTAEPQAKRAPSKKTKAN